MFAWEKFRKHKGGIEVHILYDAETQVPAFIHITEVKVKDVKAIDVTSYESGFIYVFDRAYNNYKRLVKIHMNDSFFVVRAKKNIKSKVTKWKKRLVKNILSDGEIELTSYFSPKAYPESIRMMKYWDEESQQNFSI